MGELDWTDAQTFLAVIESGSFSQAAHRLELQQPTVSRRIAKLERRLGQQLFRRGRHGAVATEAAERLALSARQMDRWAAEFERATAGFEEAVQGLVRIAAPPGIAVDHLPALARALHTRHPKLRLEVLSAVDYLDLSRGEADLAIRTQVSDDPELYIHHQAEHPVAVFAAAGYVERLTPPCDWDELDWVTWSTRYRSVAPRPMLERVIRDFQPAFAADDYLVLRAAVAEGLGAMVMGRPLGARDGAGLVEVLMKTPLPPSSYALVSAKSMAHVPRIRAVVQALLSLLKEHERPLA